MTEHVFHVAIEILQCGDRAAMAILITSQGEPPRGEQHKMLITSAGTMIGTVGDGRFDVEVWRAAQRVIATRQSHLRQFSLAAASPGKQVRPCDVVEILTEPLPIQGEAIFRALLGLKDTGHRGMLATILTDHSLYPTGRRKCLICDDGHLVGSLDDTTLEAWLAVLSQVLMEREACALETYQARDGHHLRIFLEPVLPMLTAEEGNTGRLTEGLP